MNKKTIYIIIFILIAGGLLYVGIRSMDSGESADSPPEGTTLPEGTTPSISIASVDPGDSVSIEANNFPPDTELTAYINLGGTEGVGGVDVGTTNSGSTGSFSEKYKIPSEFENESQLVIRLEGGTGYWAYHAFDNQSE